MKALVTGSRGTVGSVVCERLVARGWQAVGWDRGRARPGDTDATLALIDAERPTAVIHGALPSQPTGMDNEGWIVNEKWTGDIARACAERAIAMVYVSTVMVFTSRATGPFAPDATPDETEGYGHSKLQGERAARAANPDVRVARLGWQIGRGPGGNNMIEHLDQQMRTNGDVAASTRWLPATSHVDDSADALIDIASMPPGTYHINANTRWNFHEIVVALNALRGNPWRVRATDDFVYDQRMIDPRITVPPLDAHLPSLKQ